MRTIKIFYVFYCDTVLALGEMRNEHFLWLGIPNHSYSYSNSCHIIATVVIVPSVSPIRFVFSSRVRSYRKRMSKNAEKLKNLVSSAKQQEEDSSAQDEIDSIYRYNLRSEYGTDQNGDEYKRKAMKKLQKLFKKSSTYTQACDLYENAAKAYRLSENFQDAASCFIECAKLSEVRLENNVDACAFYCSSAQCYLYGKDIANAMKIYQIAVELHLNNARLSSAGKIYRAMAEVETKEDDNTRGKHMDMAITYWKKAIDCYEGEYRDATTVLCYTNLAELYVAKEDWKAAAEIYEQAGRISAEGNINKGAVHEYYYMALLLTFVNCARTSSQSIEPVRQLYRKFSLENRKYESSRQFKIINTCVNAFEEEDSKAFTAALYEYNKVKPLEDVEAKLFLMIKKILKLGLRNSDTSGQPDDEFKAEDDYT